VVLLQLIIGSTLCIITDLWCTGPAVAMLNEEWCCSS